MTSKITMNDINYINGINDDLDIDIAIVGAGVSGIYSAYRFLEDDRYNNKKIGIFDLNDKVGGRLESIVLPESNVTGELGGMRYLTSQKITTSLIENIFKLKNKKFKTGETSSHTFYLRGQRFKENEWEENQKKQDKFYTRYFMSEQLQGYHPDQLFNKVIAEVCLNDPWFNDSYNNKIEKQDDYNYSFKLSSEDWDNIKRNLIYYKDNSPYNQMKLYDIGFWNLLKDQLGNEGYEFLANAGSYYSNTLSWNSSEAFSYIVGDFTDGVEYKTIDEGYDQLAYSLAKRVSENDNVTLYLNSELKTFSKDKESYELELVNVNTTKTKKVKTREIILAMPKRSLELLDQDNFFFKDASHSKVSKLIDTVYAEPSLKLLLGFEYPWWRECLNSYYGKSTTDLPMRQCYYFGVDEDNQHSLLLASYNDMRTVNFWKSMIRSNDNKFIRHDEIKSKNNNLELFNEKYSDEVTNVMVEESINQLEELHDIKIPKPYASLVKDWSKDPFGGGYHAWHTGIDVQKTMKLIRKPYEYENIYIVGEAYSSDQGWTEGAFKTAEKMLQEHFGLERPEWLDSDYYLGW